jgi:hypothetical protein
MLQTHNFHSIVRVRQQEAVGFREDIERSTNVPRLDTGKSDYSDGSH